jgi:SAM-dependent methyltransferase
MTETGEYVLGVNDEEIRRLEAQHVAWTEHAFALWRRAGLRSGDAVLDLGCGPGFTSFDLARFVGPEGRVAACDQSAHYLEFLASERDRRGLPWIEPVLGPIEELDVEPGAFDAAYSRWLFCWLPDPAAALARVASWVKPGGTIALQDYLDWGAMRLLPRSERFERIVAACMRSWALHGGTIDVAGELPVIAREARLELEHLRPVARTGGPGSPEWTWIGGFLGSYLGKLVEQDLASTDEVEAMRAEWSAREDEGASLVFAPVMADVVLRRA